MSWFYRNLVRPTLFSLDSEEIHNHTLSALGWLGRHELLCEALGSFYGAPGLPIELFGLPFPNPVGLAAGMDKHAVAVPVWERLGFGFIELGGVTWHPQPGNPAPRMFRAVSDRKSTRLNSSHGYISYAVFSLKKNATTTPTAPTVPIASNTRPCSQSLHSP